MSASDRSLRRKALFAPARVVEAKQLGPFPMKYSLKSLFILIALLCVGLARVGYLRDRAEFHVHKWRQINDTGKWYLGGKEAEIALDEEWHHRMLVVRYKRAIYKPWILVSQNTDKYSEDEWAEARRIYREDLEKGLIIAFPQ